MHSAFIRGLVLLLALAFVMTACTVPPANKPPVSQPTSASLQTEGTAAAFQRLA